METTNLKIESATLRVSNKSDENRAFDIAADVNVSHDKIGRIESGTVSRDGQQLASFSRYNDNLSMSFYIPSTEQPAILDAVNSFIGEILDIQPDNLSL